ncbi:hypothetical protein L218DRAFT_1081533 [Marasmius fiardii PR-910]|nr:hypothetical protein L218DRAFT_1081533 [Marasmius fiardii PR-910]
MYAEISRVSETSSARQLTNGRVPPRPRPETNDYDNNYPVTPFRPFTSGGYRPPSAYEQQPSPFSSNGLACSSRVRIEVEVDLNVNRSWTPSAPSSPSPRRNTTVVQNNGSPSSGYNAYVLYRGGCPGVYTKWWQLKKEFNVVSKEDSVFKGFYTVEDAEASYREMIESGVIEELEGSTCADNAWVVTRGVHPKVYTDVYAALRDGLGWAGGRLYRFSDLREARRYYDQQVLNGKIERLSPFFRPGVYTYD